MKRIVVPLDGSSLAEAVLSDAIRLAGSGELVLVRPVDHASYDAAFGEASFRFAVETAREYLDKLARFLRGEGVNVAATVVRGGLCEATQTAVDTCDADMVAYATWVEPREGAGRDRLTWNLIGMSTVPVLVRHVDSLRDGLQRPPASPSVMVPLDGSALAESALPFASGLAQEGRATMWLVGVAPPSSAKLGVSPTRGRARQTDSQAARYLSGLAAGLTGDVRIKVVEGETSRALLGLTETLEITDLVMATHRRTGLSRFFLGSVTEELIHSAHCPVIVVPALDAYVEHYAHAGSESGSGLASS